MYATRSGGSEAPSTASIPSDAAVKTEFILRYTHTQSQEAGLYPLRNLPSKVDYEHFISYTTSST